MVTSTRCQFEAMDPQVMGSDGVSKNLVFSEFGDKETNPGGLYPTGASSL